VIESQTMGGVRQTPDQLTPLVNPFSISAMAEPLVHIEPTVLRQIEQIQREEGKPLERVVSELLTEALSRRKGGTAQLDWISKPMGARFDLTDKERLFAALDQQE